MEMQSSRTVPAPIPTVWAALNDPAFLKDCIPGCETIEPDGANAYRIAIAARIGPVAAKFNGRMQLSDIDPPNGYTLSFEGQGGAAGFAKGAAKVGLTPDQNGAATTMSYTVTAQVGGKIAQIGSRLVDGAAQKLADDFFARFSDKVAASAADVEVAAAPAAAEPLPTAPANASNTAWVRYVAIVVLLAVVVYLAMRGRM